MRIPKVLQNLIEGENGDKYREVIPRPFPDEWKKAGDERLKIIFDGLVEQKELKVTRAKVRAKQKETKRTTKVKKNPDNTETLQNFHGTSGTKVKTDVIPDLSSNTPVLSLGQLLWIAYYSDRMKESNFYVHGTANNAFEKSNAFRSQLNELITSVPERFNGKSLYVLPGVRNFLIKDFPLNPKILGPNLLSSQNLRDKTVSFPDSSSIKDVAEMGKVVAVCILTNVGTLSVLTFAEPFRSNESYILDLSLRVLKRNQNVRGIDFALLHKNPRWATFKAKFTDYGIEG